MRALLLLLWLAIGQGCTLTTTKGECDVTQRIDIEQSFACKPGGERTTIRFPGPVPE
jgi:hypothetical protein